VDVAEEYKHLLYWPMKTKGISDLATSQLYKWNRPNCKQCFNYLFFC